MLHMPPVLVVFHCLKWTQPPNKIQLTRYWNINVLQKLQLFLTPCWTNRSGIFFSEALKKTVVQSFILSCQTCYKGMKKIRKFFGHWLSSGDPSIPLGIYLYPFAIMGCYFCRWLISSIVYWFFFLSISKGDLFLPLSAEVGAQSSPGIDHLWMGSTRSLCSVASSSPFGISSAGVSNEKETAAFWL